MFEFLHKNRETIPAIVHNLGFIREENWKDALLIKSNRKESERFRIKLVKAYKGVGDCMDERKAKKKKNLIKEGVNLDTITERNTEQPKPSFVGGAAGFVLLNLLIDPSCDIQTAVTRTQKLYETMQWGDMEMHIDDEHGHMTDPAQLVKRTGGCGFLGVSDKVIQILNQLDLTRRGQVDGIQGTLGENIFRALREAGTKTVVLNGNHSPDAKIVINQIENKTYPKDTQFHTQPAFCWDMWATANQEVYNQFCSISEVNTSVFTHDQFQKIQAGMHLATGMLLRVAHLGPKGNVVITSDKSCLL